MRSDVARHVLLLWICAFVGLMLLVSSEAVGRATSLAPPPKASQGGGVTAPRASIDIALPSPLGIEEVDGWLIALGLPEDRLKTAREMAERFIETDSTQRASDAQKAEATAMEVATGGGLYASRESIDRFRELLRERKRVIARCVSREEAFLRSLAEYVREEDPTAVFDDISALRRRSRFDYYPTDLPSAAINLRLIRSQLSNGAPLEVNDPDAWAAAWSSHDRELATLHETRVNRAMEAILSDGEAYHEFAGDLQKMVEWRTQRLESKLRIERSIIAANKRWAESFCSMLAAGDSISFQRLVQAATYPDIYPSEFVLPDFMNRLPVDSPAAAASLSAVKAIADIEIEKVRTAEARVERQIDELAALESRNIRTPSRREALQRAIVDLKVLRRTSARTVVNVARAEPPFVSADVVKLWVKAIEDS